MTMNKDSGKNEPRAVKDYPLTYCLVLQVVMSSHSFKKKNKLNKK